MSDANPVTAKNPRQLARALDLTPSDAVDLEVRSTINDKIIEAVAKSGRTHAQLAKSAGTSRSRLTALLNRDRSHVSTDLMLRVLAALDYRTKVTFHRVQRVARRPEARSQTNQSSSSK